MEPHIIAVSPFMQSVDSLQKRYIDMELFLLSPELRDIQVFSPYHFVMFCQNTVILPFFF